MSERPRTGCFTPFPLLWSDPQSHFIVFHVKCRDGDGKVSPSLAENTLNLSFFYLKSRTMWTRAFAAWLEIPRQSGRKCIGKLSNRILPSPRWTLSSSQTVTTGEMKRKRENISFIFRTWRHQFPSFVRRSPQTKKRESKEKRSKNFSTFLSSSLIYSFPHFERKKSVVSCLLFAPFLYHSRTRRRRRSRGCMQCRRERSSQWH